MSLSDPGCNNDRDGANGFSELENATVCAAWKTGQGRK